MKCPFCGHPDTQVKDSRPNDEGTTIRRRRYCPECDSRFTTLERVQLRELSVMKRDGQSRPFDRDKIARSMQIALRKRPVDHETLEQSVNRIVQTLEGKGDAQIDASEIGQLVMDALKDLDHVAYIRYASVYRDFTEMDDFKNIMKNLRKQSS